MKYWLLLCLSISIQGCDQKRTPDYETTRAAIPDEIKLDEGKHIALILYNPEGCLPCNYILANMLNNATYLDLIGNNSFVVFPSIRPSELQDYDRLFREYGNVRVKYINDKKLFDLLKLKDKERLGGKPKWVGLNIATKQSICFGIKEVYLLDSINYHFK
jgi:hypothetical protein